MKAQIACLILLLSSWQVEAQLPDNRFKPVFEIGDIVPEVYPTEEALRAKIVDFHDAALTEAVGKYMALQWIRRVALRDADYILYLFDSTVRVESGDNPRVLLLLTPDYMLKTWGRFICEPRFASGHIVSPFYKPNTWFVTVNASDRFGGALSFEKYLIKPDGIVRLGWSNELSKIADQLPDHQ